MMYPPKKAPTMTRLKPKPPQPPPTLKFSHTPAVVEQIAPTEQSALTLQMVVPSPAHVGDRKKKGKGTSNQKSREANKNKRARERMVRLVFSHLNTSRRVAFFFLAVPKSL